MSYTFRTNQRVLESYTIKRGLGQGAFGQVYLATSDTGKEVALKLLLGQERAEVELRGVQACLNLKHPNLVHIYDLKQDAQGNDWVIMEFVLGKSLATILEQNPQGLPIATIRPWFRELAAALEYLHESGIVHRDLKPANIFVENHHIKLGDYGLCKTISSLRKQSRQVGTSQYMAPEIGTGQYNRSIDIYASGVILYELLTGRVPFNGESDAEILMKHLSSQPDLTPLPQSFQPVLARVLDKDVNRRYPTMLALAEAVEAACAEALPASEQPVPLVPPYQPTLPEPLRAARSIPTAQAVVERQPILLPDASPAAATSAVVSGPLVGSPPVNSGQELGWRETIAVAAQGLWLTPLIIMLMLVPYAAFLRAGDWYGFLKILLLTVFCSWGFLLGGWGRSYRSPDAWWPRLRYALLGATLGIVAFRLDGWFWPTVDWQEPSTKNYLTLFGLIHAEPEGFSRMAQYALYFAAIFGAGRWWRAIAVDRKERVSLWPPFAGGLLAWGLVFLWPWESGYPWAGAVVPVALAALAVQVVSPWVAPPPPVPKRLRLHK